MPSNSLKVHNVGAGSPGHLSALVEVPGHPEWTAEAEITLEEGVWTVSSLRVVPRSAEWRDGVPHLVPGGTPPGGITQTLLRRIAPSEIAPAVAAVKLNDGRRLVDFTEGEGTSQSMRRRRPAKTRLRELDYAIWAERYVEACVTSRRPIEALAKSHAFSKTHVRDIVARARDLSLLTRPPAGKAGGELTPKARALLAEEAGR